MDAFILALLQVQGQSYWPLDGPRYHIIKKIFMHAAICMLNIRASRSEQIVKTQVKRLLHCLPSRKHAYINLTPFYIVKLGFIGVYTIFLISAQKHRLLVLVRTASSRQF